MDIYWLIRCTGMQVDLHGVDMRALGNSLIGLDKIVNDGLIVLPNGRLPHRRERAEHQINVSAIRPGSLEIIAVLQTASAALPLLAEAVAQDTAQIAWQWVKGVLLMRGGRIKDGQESIDNALNMAMTKESNRHTEAVMRELGERVFQVVDRLAPHVKETVKPVGFSCSEMKFQYNDNETTDELIVDEPMAEAIRSKEDLEVSDMEKMRIRLDGYSHHNKTLKIERPDTPGKYMVAQVRDPSFEEKNNIYITTAAEKGSLDVSVKVSRRKDGEIHSLYVMDTVGEIRSFG